MRNTSSSPLNVHFQRFEFKYVVPAHTVEGIIPEFLHYMDYDTFAQQQEDKSYVVKSMYFDSPGFDCYRQKIEGHRTRKKVRIRTYENTLHASSRVFFEIKRKYDAVVMKDRVIVAYGDCRAFLEGHATSISIIEGSQDTMDEFVWLLEYNTMIPQIMVYYRRRPFFAKFDPGFRVTIDTGLTTWRATRLDDRGFPLVVDAEFAVLEVKCNNTLPEWFHHLIRKYQLERSAYSKYCNALECCRPEIGARTL